MPSTTSQLTSQQIIEFLDDRSLAEEWLSGLGITDARRAHDNLVRIAQAGVTIDLLVMLGKRLMRELPLVSDPDMALNNLERFVQASRSPLSLASLFERDLEALHVLLQMFSTSQYLSDVLIQEPSTYDLLRMTDGTPVSREVLLEELSSEIRLCRDEPTAMSLLRVFKRRETARIVYGDIIRSQRIETVTRQISYLAEVICEAALAVAESSLQPKYGQPRTAGGDLARIVILALGKLGGQELNYSSDIDLMFLYDEEGRTDGDRSISNREYFEKLVKRFVQLLTEKTDRGFCYRVDLRLRPEGKQGPVVSQRDAAYRYYDEKGRTWERQAFVKARPIAGAMELGTEFLHRLMPWIYRRYLSRADITGIKALKRRIERRAREDSYR